jgi:signal transduction histidine kinase
MNGSRISWVAWGGVGAFPVLLHVTVLNLKEARTPLQVLLPAVLMALPAGLLRRQPLPALALMLAGSFAVTASLGTAAVGYSQVLLSGIAAGVVAVVAGRRVSLAGMIATIGVQIAAVPYYTAGSDYFVLSVMFAALAVFAGWTTGDSLRQRRGYADTLRSEAAAQAATAERLRIARDVHDMIAHSIGVVAIQAGVGRRVIDTQPVEARKAFDVIEATSRQTLAELRQVLGGLREPAPDAAPLSPAPGLADLPRIAAAAEDAGVRVAVSRKGDARPLPAHIDLSVFRIIQEALTNVVRHSDARECQVTIDRCRAELRIEVVDDGAGAATSPSGYGMRGMRERAELLNGEFDAGPRPGGGFRVTARLPVPAA